MEELWSWIYEALLPTNYVALGYRPSSLSASLLVYNRKVLQTLRMVVRTGNDARSVLGRD